MASPILGKHPLSPLSRNKDEDKSSHRASGSCLEQKQDVGTGKGQWERRLEGAPEASGASNSAYRWWDTPESKESMRRKLSGHHRRNSEFSPGGRWQEACQEWRRRRRAAPRQGSGPWSHPGGQTAGDQHRDGCHESHMWVGSLTFLLSLYPKLRVGCCEGICGVIQSPQHHLIHSGDVCGGPAVFKRDASIPGLASQPGTEGDRQEGPMTPEGHAKEEKGRALQLGTPCVPGHRAKKQLVR